MTPPEYSAIKWLTDQPQWKIYLAFLENESNRLLELIPGEWDRDKVWDLRTQVTEMRRTASLAQSSISEYEYAQKEMTKNAK